MIFNQQNINDLIKKLEDAKISIITVEAMSDPEKPDTHIKSLKVGRNSSKFSNKFFTRLPSTQTTTNHIYS